MDDDADARLAAVMAQDERCERAIALRAVDGPAAIAELSELLADARPLVRALAAASLVQRSVVTGQVLSVVADPRCVEPGSTYFPLDALRAPAEPALTALLADPATLAAVPGLIRVAARCHEAQALVALITRIVEARAAELSSDALATLATFEGPEQYVATELEDRGGHLPRYAYEPLPALDCAPLHRIARTELARRRQ